MGRLRILLICSVLAVAPLGPAVASTATAADAVQPTLEIEQTTIGNIFTGKGPKRSFELETTAPRVRWTVLDYWGAKVAQGASSIDSDRVKLEVRVRNPGYYELLVDAGQGAARVSARTTFAVLTEAKRDGVADFTFGMQTHFGQNANQNARPYDRRLIPLLRYAGVQAVRDAQPWQAIEVAKGQYDFSLEDGRFTRYMAELEDHGIAPMVQFGLFSRFYDNGATPHSAAGQQAYAEFGRAVVEQYGEQIQEVGVYNEPNSRKFGDHGSGPADATPSNYFGILRATSQEIGRIRPDITVSGPELAAGLGSQSGWMPWLTELAELGGFDHLDAVSVHPYRVGTAPEGLAAHLAPVRQLMAEHGAADLPLWITELGWPTNEPPAERTQAEYLPRAYLSAIAQDVERFNWYNFLDHASGPFGLLRREESGLGPHTPKPAYAAYAAMTEQLSDTEYRGPDETPDGIRSERFESPAGSTRAIWSPGGERTVVLEARQPVRVTDAMGVEHTLEPVDGTVVLTVTPDVSYLDGEITAIRPGGGYRIEAPDTAVSEDIQTTLELDNTTGDRAAATFEVNGEAYRLRAPEGEVTRRTITVESNERIGQRRIFGSVKVAGRQHALISSGLDVDQDLDVLVRPRVTDPDSGRGALGVELTNNLRTERTLGTLDWSVGASEGHRDLDVSLGAGETRTLTVELSADVEFWRSYPYAVRVGGGGTPAAATGTTAFNPVLRHSLSVDGDVAELRNLARIGMQQHGRVVRTPTGEPYGGPSDLSGPIWVTADAENLYIAVRATDDQHRQIHSGQATWQGDSIQFGLAAGVPGEASDYYEYTVARTADGPQVYRHHAPAGESRGPTDDPVAVVRDDGAAATTYELAISWADLAQIQPDDDWFSLSLLTNDDDGVDREGWIEWGSGVGRGKDPTAFNPMALVNPGAAGGR